MKIKMFKYFYPEKPKLMSVDQPLFQELSESDDWVAERKYNGSRLAFHVGSGLDFSWGDFAFFNRHEAEMDFSPADYLMNHLESIPFKGYCLLDGELRHNKTKGVQQKIVFYDAFIWDNELLTDAPFWYRREILERMVGGVNREPVGIPEQFPGNFKSIFNTVIKDPEIEGLVMKNIHGHLQLGRTSAVDSQWMWKVREPSGRYKF